MPTKTLEEVIAYLTERASLLEQALKGDKEFLGSSYDPWAYGVVCDTAALDECCYTLKFIRGEFDDQ